MKSIQLNNYRCFSDTTKIQLKPITFLLGANSCGKSSFLKFFPLLQQSINRKLKGIFLWNAEDGIDFDNFKNTVKTGESEMTISMDLEIAKSPYLYARQDTKGVKFKIILHNIDEDNDYIKELNISFSDISFTLYFNGTKIDYVEINEVKYNGNTLNINTEFGQGLLPNFDIRPQGLSFDEQQMLILREVRYNPSTMSIKDIKKLIQNKIKKNKIQISNIDDFVNKIILIQIERIIYSINVYFISLANNIHYIKPLRKITQRYYRIQSYSVDNIDSDGTNLPMYFYNLPKSRLNDFNAWLSDIFQFSLNVKKQGNNFEIQILDSSTKKNTKENLVPRNLVDVGFGYTQILPILTLIWDVSTGGNRDSNAPYYSNEHIIAIEQPELHLHPRFQNLFGDILVKAVNYCKAKNNIDIKIIIETHSERIINRIGQCVASKAIDSKDINVVFFNAKKEGISNNYVKSTSYNENGLIEKWPFGFFE